MQKWWVSRLIQHNNYVTHLCIVAVYNNKGVETIDTYMHTYKCTCIHKYT